MFAPQKSFLLGLGIAYMSRIFRQVLR